VTAIHASFGPGWDVVEVRAPAESDGDGGAGSAEAAVAARGAEVYVGWGIPAGVADAARGTLEWAHTAAAGVGGSITPAFRATGATLTNSASVYAEPIADWVLAALGFCLRGFHRAVAASREPRWAKGAFTDRRGVVRELAGTRVGIVGLGGIGRAVARRCAALHMEVRGIRRRPGVRRPRGVRWVGGSGDLERLAAESDVLVIAAASTRATRGLVDRAALAALPDGAYVLNVARGALLDEAALLDQLDAGRLGGAVLDVFAAEPLPPGHRFWTHPRVFVTPHVAGVSDRFWEREVALLAENVERYRRGRRLKNIVDLDAGY
jgi:phosphoglycerate dehydrogenase-like enzyme